ncbi:MAG: ABC transporter ATP-binding protein [Burkholderiales bacterium]
MLEIERLSVYYGLAQVLFELTLDVRKAEIAVLLGRNGAGKSTCLKSIIGLLHPMSGAIRFEGRRIDRLEPFQIARLGLGYVPEDRRIFADLTVMQNLEVGRQAACDRPSRWTPRRLFELFPNLGRMQNRLGGRMSGGEQQMLTIARTLMGNPKAILLDEPSEGLAPLIAQQLADTVLELRREGLTILLCEQSLYFAQRVADRAFILENGHVRYAGTMQSLAADAEVRNQYLSV